MRMDRKEFYRELLEAYQKELPDYIIQPYEGMRENIGRQKGIGIGKDVLFDMVKEVNHTVVSRDERLADNVYYYDRKTKEMRALF